MIVKSAPCYADRSRSRLRPAHTCSREVPKQATSPTSARMRDSSLLADPVPHLNSCLCCAATAHAHPSFEADLRAHLFGGNAHYEHQFGRGGSCMTSYSAGGQS